MSDTDRSDYSDAWNEDATEGQPDEGRPGAAAQPAEDDAGAQPDAERPADEAQPSDAERPAEGEETTDEFAGLSNDQIIERARAAAKEAQEFRDRAAKAENTLRSNESRFSRAEREKNELQARLAALAPKVEPQTAPAVAEVSEEALAAVEEEYPDIGKPLVQTIKALRSQVESLVQAGAKAQEVEQAKATLEHQEYLGRQEQVLAEKHPDWTEVVASPAYAAWVPNQPAWVFDLITRNGQSLVDGEAAAAVLERFKAETAAPADPEAERRNRQREGSRLVPARVPAMEARSNTSGSYKDEWARADEEDKRKSARR